MIRVGTLGLRIDCRWAVCVAAIVRSWSILLLIGCMTTRNRNRIRWRGGAVWARWLRSFMDETTHFLLKLRARHVRVIRSRVVDAHAHRLNLLSVHNPLCLCELGL